MRVLLVNENFHPEVAAVAQYMVDLCEDFTREGFQVSVLCGRGRYENRRNRTTEALRECLASITVHRVPSCRLRSTGGRLFGYALFHLAALMRSLFLRRIDCVIAFTAPPLIAFVGVVLRWIRGTPFVYVVEDLYPDVAIALVLMDEASMAGRLLQRLSGWILRRADEVIAIGSLMRVRLLRYGVDPAKIHVVHNWADDTAIYPAKARRDLSGGTIDLRDRFVVQYSGHMGEAHSFEELLDAARRLRTDERFVFLLVGGGPKEGGIRAAIESDSLTNVLLVPYQDRADLPATLNTATVSFVCLHPDLEGLIVPSKIYGAMAAGKPILFLGSPNGEIAQIVERARCGRVVRSGDFESLVDAIRELQADPELVKTLGKNARDYLVENFARSKQTAKHARVVAKAVHGSVPR